MFGLLFVVISMHHTVHRLVVLQLVIVSAYLHSIRIF